jgi:hypothetical protein
MIQSGIKPKRSFVDPFYKPEYQGSYYLSLQLGRDALYAAILDLKSNTYIGVEEHIFEGLQNVFQLQTEFERCYNSSSLLQAQFEKVNVGIINEYATIVPDALFDEERKTQYFEFTQERQEDYAISDDNLINLKARNIFAIPHVVREAVAAKFPQASIKHASTSIIDGLSLKYKQDEGEVVAIHVQYSHFEILYFKNGMLQYFNSFNYTTAEDFIYYTLFAFEQLGINTEKIQVEVLGEIDQDSGAYNLLFKYVRNVSLGNRPKVLNYSTALDTLSGSYYYNLFQQFLCA